jgi:hypothetical protein
MAESTAQGGPNIVYDSSLVLYLDAANKLSYPGNGTTWYDLSKNNYNLTLSGSTSFGGGNYIQFNSSSLDYAYLNTTAFQNYTNITAIIWKYSMTHTVAFESYFGYDYDGGSSATGWAIRNRVPANNTNQFQGWGSNGTNLGNNLNLYLNSNLVGSSTTAGVLSPLDLDVTGSWQMITLTATGVTSWQNNYNLMIGRRPDWIGGGPLTGMDARISCALLYNRALSSTEVTQNYNALKYRFGL